MKKIKFIWNHTEHIGNIIKQYTSCMGPATEIIITAMNGIPIKKMSFTLYGNVEAGKTCGPVKVISITETKLDRILN